MASIDEIVSWLRSKADELGRSSDPETKTAGDHVAEVADEAAGLFGEDPPVETPPVEGVEGEGVVTPDVEKPAEGDVIAPS